MNTEELIQWLARDSKVAPAAAADTIESAVAHIIKRLRRGTPVTLPGIGVLQPARENGVVLTPPPPAKATKRTNRGRR
jgi:nucleoid DNA-binding protein